jgi:hypothetical protein
MELQKVLPSLFGSLSYLLSVFLLNMSIEFPTMQVLISSALIKESSHSSSEGIQLCCPCQRSRACFDRSKRAIFLMGCD